MCRACRKLLVTPGESPPGSPRLLVNPASWRGSYRCGRSFASTLPTRRVVRSAALENGAQRLHSGFQELAVFSMYPSATAPRDLSAVIFGLSASFPFERTPLCFLPPHSRAADSMLQGRSRADDAAGGDG
eukprot:tig00020553_g10745.t1